MEKVVYLLNPSLEDISKACEKGFGALLVPSTVISEMLVSQVKHVSDAMKIYADLSVFVRVGKSDIVLADGREASYGTLSAVCPTNQEHRDEKIKEFTALLSNANISGVLLDELGYPSICGREEPDLMDGCYCGRCIAKFQEDYLYGDKLPTKLSELVDAIDGQYYIEWMEFKCRNITSFAEEVRELVKSSGRDFKIGIFITAWKDKDFGSAITRILGQDFSGLGTAADFLSPVLDVGKSEDEILAYINYVQVFGKTYPYLAGDTIPKIGDKLKTAGAVVADLS